jgi:hypothetical protein
LSDVKNIHTKLYKTVLLPTVLYGCETWFLILREEYRLRVFDKKVLGRRVGTRRDEIIGGWRKLLDEELHGLYSLLHIVTCISH